MTLPRTWLRYGRTSGRRPKGTANSAELPQLADKDIRIAMDEWNYWFRPYVYGELACIYRLRDALGIAAGIHEYSRSTDIISMAHYAQTVNVIGCIKTTKTAAAFETTGLSLMLYRNHYGTIPVEVSRPTAGPIDVAAAWTEDRRALTVGVVNSHRTSQRISLELQGARLAGSGTLWAIEGQSADPTLYNQPGQSPQVEIGQKQLTGIDRLLELPPLSVSVFRLDVK